MKKTVESQVADTILQAPIKIKIGEIEYIAAKPTTATLIEASKFISTFPSAEIKDEANILFEALAVASECGYIGHVMAVLILGAKNIKKTHSVKYILGFIPKRIETDPVSELSEIIINELSPKEIFNHTIQLLQDLEVGFFLNTIIFLRDVNLLKKTKF